MKKYKVNVNGTDYEITVELLDDSCQTTSNTSSHAPSSVTPIPHASASTTTSSNASTLKICSPMPGTLLSISCTVGALVKKGDTLMILEAMKMENEILAPRDGKIITLHATKGAAVESGTLLCEIQ